MLFAFFFFWGKKLFLWLKQQLCDRKKKNVNEEPREPQGSGEEDSDEEFPNNSGLMNESDARPILAEEPETGFDRHHGVKRVNAKSSK